MVGTWLSHLCCVPISQEPAARSSVSATPGPAPASAPQGPRPRGGVGACPCSHCPSCGHLPRSEEGLRPEVRPFALCPLCPDQIPPLGTGQGVWVLEHGSPPTRRHSDPWGRARGRPHAAWVSWEQVTTLQPCPRGLGRRPVPACLRPLALRTPPRGEWCRRPGPAPRPSLPPPWLWHR